MGQISGLRRSLGIYMLLLPFVISCIIMPERVLKLLPVCCASRFVGRAEGGNGFSDTLWQGTRSFIKALACRTRCRTYLSSPYRSCRSSLPQALGFRTHCRIYRSWVCRSSGSTIPLSPGQDSLRTAPCLPAPLHLDSFQPAPCLQAPLGLDPSLSAAPLPAPLGLGSSRPAAPLPPTSSPGSASAAYSYWRQRP